MFYSLPGGAAKGGGIANLGTVTIVHSTAARNTAIGGDSIPNQNFANSGGPAFGGGIYLDSDSSLVTRNTIWALNQALGGQGAPDGSTTGPDVNGTVNSDGHNLLGRSDGCTGFTKQDLRGGTSDETKLDPRLGPFGDNGGPTETLALLSGSPAINAADTAPPARDQRNYERAGPPDIGAFEFEGTQPIYLVNMSTRLNVQTGDNALIGRFIITGTQPKTIIIRGIGPSLSIDGALADPVMEVYGPDGQFLGANGNWRDALTKQQIIGSGLAPTSNLESALWGVINPGLYTVVVRGNDNTTGIALFEVYDLDQTVDSKLANISTRGLVTNGDNVMIGGATVVGSPPARFLFRAIGPSLAQSGVSNALANPSLELHDGNGEVIAGNNNWREDQEAEIMATGVPPSNDLEAAIVQDLTPGLYTAVLRGEDDATGVALVEVYDLN